jgi:hypothetical protein
MKGDFRSGERNKDGNAKVRLVRILARIKAKRKGKK